MALTKITKSGIKDGDVVEKASPQLGGQLDVNGQAIGDGTAELIKFSETGSAVNEVTITNAATSNGPEISATGGDTNIDLKLTPKGSGKLNLDGIKFPNADGSADQILTTNGSGVLSFVDNSGGTDWQSSVKTANFTAAAGEGYFVNTSGGAFEIDLPGSPSVGDEIEFVDFSRSFGTNKLTLDQGSLKFQGFTSPKPEYNTDGQSIKIVYSGTTQGWIPVRDDDVTYETPQTYSIDYLVIGGGGGGGTGQNAPYNRSGGGGGAGGYRASYNSEASGGGGSSETALSLDTGVVLTADIGAGGAGSTASGGGDGTQGTDTTLTGTGVSITSAGGGKGSGDTGNGAAGGSGGGGGAINGSTNGGAGTTNQGFAGSGGAGNLGGAGGGAGEAGGTDDGPSGYTDKNTAGGDGVASTITGSSVVRAGGGSGATSTTVTPGSDGGGGTGGSGGGNSTGTAGGNGTANTGSGGGSAGENGGSSGNGGTGGSGVVILRMPTSRYSGTTTGSPTVTTSGSDTIIVFNGDGSYTT